MNFRTVSFLGLFPQIQMIALCNSRAMGEADENSDIDLFIITKKGNLWTGRFLVTALTALLGVRRRNTHGLQKGTPEYIKRTKNKFCLSFFITEEAMNLDSVRLQPNDPYLDRWIYTLIPLVNKNAIYEHFMEANGAEPTYSPINPSWRVFCMKLGSIFGFLSLFESIIKKLWSPKTLKTYENLGKPWGVVISDTMLKFHDNDQRRKYREKLPAN
ncbi:nucleotidyltransferase domain-containing protein [Candidatus Gracilibacteria bacterium]|nr:nucleotidyltransferase domain-containing protein [Candidatus Gracilibacteria bacterium]